jgi:molybdopterin converting factor small subunit
MIISTVLSEKPLIEGNSVTLKICKSGTKAYDSKGKEYILTKEALESSAKSWTGGIVTINHMVKEKGKITKSWFEDPYVYATFEGLSPETVDAINSKAYRGVSQESEPVKVDGNKVLQLKGTGSTFVFYPFKPACPIKEGCGLPIASCDPDFNFPLYSHDENFTTDTPGGVNITEADQSAKLESTISDLKTENKNLKSTIDELRKELTEKDGKIESTVNAAVKAALESHDKALKEQTEREAVFSELKSSVSPETLDGLKDAPVSILKSTLAAIKETAGKHVGANSGTGTQSTEDETDYASLGVTSIEVE